MANFVILDISMQFAVNWFRNVNLALYSNRIMPDRCLVYGGSNRSDMIAGISAHFSPTIKSERDRWLRFVHTHRASLNPSGKFVAGVFSPFRGRMFFNSVSHGRLSSSAYSWLNSYNMEDRARETSSKRQHRKVSLFQFYLVSFSIVSTIKFSFA